MPKQEEIKAAMATYFAFREPTRSGMATIRLPSRPSAKETTAAAFVLAEAYIEEHDDTPITLDEATELCKGSKYVMIATFSGTDVFAEIGTKDMTDYFHVEMKSRNQLLALLKGIGE